MTGSFSYVNKIDNAATALSAGDAVSTLPIANLQDPRVQKVWRSGTSYATWFGADLGAALPIEVIGLFGCSFGSTDTVRIRLSAVTLGAGELLDTTATASNIVAIYGQYVVLTGTLINARYIRVDVSAPSRSGLGYFDVGRLWAGPLWTPAFNYSLGWGEQWKDTSIIARSPRSGAIFVDTAASFRSFDMTFDYLSEDDRAQAMTMDNTAGKRGQILFIPDLAGTLTTGPLLGRMVDTGQIKQDLRVSPPVFVRVYSLEQDL